MLITLSTLLGGAIKTLCHVNMLKKYNDRDSSVISSVNLVNTVPLEQNQIDSEDMNCKI